MTAPKLNAATIKLLREAAETESEFGDRRIGNALEMLLDWHDRPAPANDNSAAACADFLRALGGNPDLPADPLTICAEAVFGVEIGAKNGNDAGSRAIGLLPPNATPLMKGIAYGLAACRFALLAKR